LAGGINKLPHSTLKIPDPGVVHHRVPYEHVVAVVEHDPGLVRVAYEQVLHHDVVAGTELEQTLRRRIFYTCVSLDSNIPYIYVPM
jgi:hypothetical protein